MPEQRAHARTDGRLQETKESEHARMTDLTEQDVLDLIHDVEAGRESAATHPFASSRADKPPHLIWGLGEAQPLAVGVTEHGMQFRTGEYWASGWDDLEPTEDPWVIEGVQRNAVALVCDDADAPPTATRPAEATASSSTLRQALHQPVPLCCSQTHQHRRSGCSHRPSCR